MPGSFYNNSCACRLLFKHVTTSLPARKPHCCPTCPLISFCWVFLTCGTQQVLRLLSNHGPVVAASTPDGQARFSIDEFSFVDPTVRWIRPRCEAAVVNGSPEQPFRPLIWAAMVGQIEGIRLLAERGADLDVSQAVDFYIFDETLGEVFLRKGSRAVHAAAIVGHVAVIRMLLELGANPDPRDDERAGLPLRRPSRAPSPVDAA